MTSSCYTNILVGMLKQRNPDQTRYDLLQAAMQEIYQYGYKGASLNRILDRTSVTKGALYHHFSTKQALGYAVVDELIAQYMDQFWITPLNNCHDPLTATWEAIQQTYRDHSESFVQFGCPLNNLSQEMSATDEGFRTRINTLHERWEQALASALQRGKALGLVKPEVETVPTALFIVASVDGCIGIAKTKQCHETLATCNKALFTYLQSLRQV